MTENISPNQCLAMIDDIFIEVCQEGGLLSARSLRVARKIQKRYFKQGEHASIQDILLYEGLIGREQVDLIYSQHGNSIFGCVDCNVIKRFERLAPDHCETCKGHLVRVFRSPAGDRSTVVTNELPGSDGYRFSKGAMIGEYVVRQTIGSGSMGLVFRARGKGGEQVALKVLYPDGGVTWEDVKRFQHEILSLRGLSHEHIMSITHDGVVDELYYYCMELVEGESLGGRIAAARLTPEETLSIGAYLARALAHIHSRGVVHRDLKPENILFDEQGSLRIVDFGIAKNAMQSTQVTEYGTALGTPAYMAPEQARGEIHKVSPGTDIYALGVLLYEMSTGVIPFEEEQNVSRLLDRIERDEPKLPREHDPSISKELESVILRAMVKDPAGRYPDAESMAEDLESLSRGEPPLHVNALPDEAGFWGKLLKRFESDS